MKKKKNASSKFRGEQVSRSHLFTRLWGKIQNVKTKLNTSRERSAEDLVS